MCVRCYECPRKFGEDVIPWLLPEEARNHLLISLICGLGETATGNRESAPPVMATACEESGEIAAITLRTPPHNALISAGPAAAIKALARWYAERKEPLPGVMGPVEESRLFAATWANETGVSYRARFELIAHELTKVCRPRGVRGRMRYAELSERDTLIEWAAGFQRDTGVSHKPPPESVISAYLNDRATCVWDVEGEIVSMALMIRGTPSGKRIGGVYTPPEKRGNGYASAVVAAASQHILDQGMSRCFLFTDAANPTSNHIYRQIGYEPVGEFTEYAFG